MMIDIDYFKNYNDTYGHDEGDKCLKIVTEALAKNILRTEDFIVRYGGEEFVAVLPYTDEKGAHIMAEKLLESVRQCNLPHINSDVADHVTVSIGATTGIVHHTHTKDDYIKRADEMLYSAKQGGRDRYVYGKLKETE